MTEIFNQSTQLTQRRKLRNHMPFAERLLWYYLRRKYLDGHKFRRQVSIGPFVADFYCPKAHLAIEVDGDTHATTEAYDAQRTKYLQSLGIAVLRFTNQEIYHQRDAVVATIARHLSRPPLAPPS